MIDLPLVNRMMRIARLKWEAAPAGSDLALLMWRQYAHWLDRASRAMDEFLYSDFGVSNG